jgi:hypothetical protein
VWARRPTFITVFKLTVGLNGSFFVIELYMLAFGPLRSVFDTKELASFADAMAERNIRMRKGLDEVLEEWRSRLEDKMDYEEGDVDPELDDDIEEDARELRRLRPY